MSYEYENVKVVFDDVIIKSNYTKPYTWIDIETRKVPTPDGFVMDNGERLKKRWEPFMIGTAFEFDGDLAFDLSYNWYNNDWVTYMNNLSVDTDKLIYIATREFDEMILKGRFTNARRAHLSKRGPWPGIDEKLFDWINIRKIAKQRPWNRESDIFGLDVPKAFENGDVDLILMHLLKDLAMMPLIDPNVEVVKGSKKLIRILESNKYAMKYISDY